MSDKKIILQEIVNQKIHKYTRNIDFNIDSLYKKVDLIDVSLLNDLKRDIKFNPANKVIDSYLLKSKELKGVRSC